MTASQAPTECVSCKSGRILAGRFDCGEDGMAYFTPAGSRRATLKEALLGPAAALRFDGAGWVCADCGLVWAQLSGPYVRKRVAAFGSKATLEHLDLAAPQARGREQGQDQRGPLGSTWAWARFLMRKEGADVADGAFSRREAVLGLCIPVAAIVAIILMRALR